MSVDDEPRSRDGDVLLVDAYRKAADGAEYGYRGLRIHAMAGLHERVGELVRQHFPPAARVLDLASGSGALGARLRDLGCDVTCCDIVRENFRLHGQLPFVEANLNRDFGGELPGPFDAICAVEIVEHLENPRHFLRQCRALLRPGGRLLLSTPNIESTTSIEQLLRKGTFALFNDTHYAESGHITPIGQWQLRKMLDEAGFDAVAFDGCSAPRRGGLSMRALRRRLLQWLTSASREAGDILIALATAR